MNSIKLVQSVIDNNSVHYYFEVSDGISKYFAKNEFTITYEENISKIPLSILNIPFVSLMLPVSWLTDAIIWVKELDATFYNSIFNIKRAYQAFYKDYQFGGTVVSAYVPQNKIIHSNRAVLLFSGGLDCVSSYVNNRDKEFTFLNIYGWNESASKSKEKYYSDKNNMVEFCNRERTSISFIESNFATIINSLFNRLMQRKLNNTLWYGMQHSMMFISIAIPYAYNHDIDTIYIASSNVIGFRIACASDPTTDIEFKYAEVGSVIHDGFELTRQDKIRKIIQYRKSISKPFPLQVCSFNDHNCCECEKCFRTILGLVAENEKISDYGFFINTSLKQHFINVLERKEQFMGFDFEERCYWGEIKARMKENYSQISDKEFVDWFLKYDFKAGKRKAVFEYRRKNFVKLLAQKIGIKEH